jgi:predicted GNAT family acetyltransferase
MTLWGRTARKPEPQEVTTGRFEIERDGQVAYLEYKLTAKVLELIHTEVPEPLRGMGLSASLAETALQWARENHRKVDVICPSVLDYVAKHPEYSDLVMR